MDPLMREALGVYLWHIFVPACALFGLACLMTWLGMRKR